jgi:4-hydroxythreonine-4-phosphate dehydrogenase
MHSEPRPVGVTMGDPCGIGPEIVVGALAARDRVPGPVIVFGDPDRLRQAAGILGADLPVVEVDPGAAPLPDGLACVPVTRDASALPFGTVSARSGAAAHAYVAAAVEAVTAGRIAAICTAPLSKEALHAAGHRFPGHTELLAALSGTAEVSMMLLAPGLRVVHVTTHMGLLDAIAAIEPGRVAATIRRAHAALSQAGIAPVRIGVCGINPHAGENGLFGRGEEEEKIVPAVARLRAEGLDVVGPLPADTLFFRARRGDFDLVVAMYHDQGHGPVKVLGLEAGVNMTLGLPFVRTSVDHGTAVDIAGTGRADPRSLLAALEAAFDFADHRARGALPDAG